MADGYDRYDGFIDQVLRTGYCRTQNVKASESQQKSSQGRSSGGDLCLHSPMFVLRLELLLMIKVKSVLFSDLES
jgi:hypothetical protein